MAKGMSRCEMELSVAYLELGLRWLHDRAEDDLAGEGAFIAGMAAGAFAGFVMGKMGAQEVPFVERLARRKAKAN